MGIEEEGARRGGRRPGPERLRVSTLGSWRGPGKGLEGEATRMKEKLKTWIPDPTLPRASRTQDPRSSSIF